MIDGQQQLLTNANTEPKRVKVYLLENDEWKDTGTGFCVGQCEQALGCAYLLVRDEEQPDRILLKSKLEGNIEYQRQEETLIVWKDIQGHDIALSFEESTGCNALCEFICLIQKTFENNISLVSVRSNDDGMGSVHEIITGPVHLPSNDAVQNEDTLMEALRILNENTAFEFLKSETVDFIINSDYVRTLIDHFQFAEKTHLHRNLLLLSHIVKTLFLYNQRVLIEQLIDDDHYMGVFGILEYDTEYPDCKANHRNCLQQTRTSLKEVIPLNDDHMKQIIKKTLRLQFLKDVVLVRFLDDHSATLITEVMLEYQSSIINFLQQSQFIDDLMAMYVGNLGAIDPVFLEKKRQGIKLLDECVQITCNLAPAERSSFYKVLVKKGLFNVLDFAFNIETSSEVRILATDMIISIIEFDILLINTVQNEMIDQTLDEEHNGRITNNTEVSEGEKLEGEGNCNGQKSNPAGSQVQNHSSDISLLLILSKILLTDKSPGLKEQAFQALITLLDPEDFLGDGYEDQSSIESLMKFCANNRIRERQAGPQFQLIDYFNKFYKEVAPVLFECLITGDVADKDDQLLLKLIKLVDLLVNEHDIVVSRGFILENGILMTVSKLMGPSHVIQLRLAALRLFKGIVRLNDDFYYRYLISKNLMDPIRQILEENLYENNMANSCVMDFLKLVSTHCQQAQEVSDFNRKNYVSLNIYMVERFGEILERVDYVSFTTNMIRMAHSSKNNVHRNAQEAEDNSLPVDPQASAEYDYEGTPGLIDASLEGDANEEEVAMGSDISVPASISTKRTYSDLEETAASVINLAAPTRQQQFSKIAEKVPTSE
ncbi:HBR285Cp [Eremothecium sinecaudum]|uniref:Serine/threonine-protein phosphatase 4 regulatory subunit 3 n=1 Tax=Eremothecium sinecaudum TaxID=45286 RepID=A0A120K1B7_9SACH|nr:HBR285Cp [Eremothecium sinecaudum]AMD19186.1 HBR285Cp [Eremothecium sinecaudum]